MITLGGQSKPVLPPLVSEQSGASLSAFTTDTTTWTVESSCITSRRSGGRFGVTSRAGLFTSLAPLGSVSIVEFDMRFTGISDSVFAGVSFSTRAGYYGGTDGTYQHLEYSVLYPADSGHQGWSRYRLETIGGITTIYVDGVVDTVGPSRIAGFVQFHVYVGPGASTETTPVQFANISIFNSPLTNP